MNYKLRHAEKILAINTNEESCSRVGEDVLFSIVVSE
uniref:Uncharacterized protein n=1 Tax=Ciona intestinalis TaxID=7719 RepID=H2XX52_CIOIN